MNIGFSRSLSHLILSFCVCIAPAAQAQLFTDDAARDLARKNNEDIANMRELLRDLNAAIEKTRQQMSILTQKNQTLEAQIRTLNGNIEELQHQLSVAQNQDDPVQQAKSIAQEKKLGNLETALAVLQQRLNELSQFVTLPSEDQLYADAYTDYQEQNYAGAIEGFNRVLEFYPDGQFSANCRYWLGQAHLIQENYTASLENAQRLLNDYPQNDKTPAALLILAKSYYGMEMPDDAQTQLQLLLARYPTSLAADSARQLLSR